MTHQVPQFRRDLPLIEQDWWLRSQEDLRGGVDQCASPVVGVHTEQRGSDSLGCRSLAACLGALHDDGASGSHPVRELTICHAGTVLDDASLLLSKTENPPIGNRQVL